MGKSGRFLILFKNEGGRVSPRFKIFVSDVNYQNEGAGYMSKVQNYDIFQLVISTVRHQFYLNNVIKIHLVELNGCPTT